MPQTSTGNASQTELNKFVKIVDEFKAKHTQLILPSTRSQVYATKNAKLIADYNSLVSRGNSLNDTIANLVGAWDAAKRGWTNLTDTTSLYIGDAVDWLRGLWGGGSSADTKDLSGQGLGAVQAVAAIPAALAIAGVISVALVLNSGMNKIFVHLNANAIQRENPDISRANALATATSNLPSLLPGGLSLPMMAAGAIALYFILGPK